MDLLTATCVQFVLTRQAAPTDTLKIHVSDPMSSMEGGAKGAARRRNYLTTAMML